MKKPSKKQLDKLCSLYIRTRDKWTCQRCGKFYRPPTNALHWAHIFTRTKGSTRYDPNNAVALCYGCHSYLDRNPLEKYEWYKHKFGEEAFDALRLRSNICRKIDPILTRLALTSLLAELKCNL